MDAIVKLFCLCSLLATTYGFKKLECSADPTISVNATCSQTVTRRNTQVVYGITLLKSANKVFLRVAQLKRNSANQYLNGPFDVTQDLCAMSSPSSLQFFKNFVTMLDEPGQFDKYKDLLHPCPYSGRIEVKLTYKADKGRKSVSGPVLGRGDYKTLLRISNEANRTIYELNTYYSI